MEICNILILVAAIMLWCLLKAISELTLGQGEIVELTLIDNKLKNGKKFGSELKLDKGPNYQIFSLNCSKLPSFNLRLNSE